MDQIRTSDDNTSEFRSSESATAAMVERKGVQALSSALATADLIDNNEDGHSESVLRDQIVEGSVVDENDPVTRSDDYMADDPLAKERAWSAGATSQSSDGDSVEAQITGSPCPATKDDRLSQNSEAKEVLSLGTDSGDLDFDHEDVQLPALQIAHAEDRSASGLSLVSADTASQVEREMHARHIPVVEDEAFSQGNCVADEASFTEDSAAQMVEDEDIRSPALQEELADRNAMRAGPHPSLETNEASLLKEVNDALPGPVSGSEGPTQTESGSNDMLSATSAVDDTCSGETQDVEPAHIHQQPGLEGADGAFSDIETSQSNEASLSKKINGTGPGHMSGNYEPTRAKSGTSDMLSATSAVDDTCSEENQDVELAHVHQQPGLEDADGVFSDTETSQSNEASLFKEVNGTGPGNISGNEGPTRAKSGTNEMLSATSAVDDTCSGENQDVEPAHIHQQPGLEDADGVFSDIETSQSNEASLSKEINGTGPGHVSGNEEPTRAKSGTNEMLSATSAVDDTCLGENQDVEPAYINQQPGLEDADGVFSDSETSQSNKASLLKEINGTGPGDMSGNEGPTRTKSGTNEMLSATSAVDDICSGENQDVEPAHIHQQPGLEDADGVFTDIETSQSNEASLFKELNGTGSGHMSGNEGPTPAKSGSNDMLSATFAVDNTCSGENQGVEPGHIHKQPALEGADGVCLDVEASQSNEASLSKEITGAGPGPVSGSERPAHAKSGTNDMLSAASAVADTCSGESQGVEPAPMHTRPVFEGGDGVFSDIETSQSSPVDGVEGGEPEVKKKDGQQEELDEVEAGTPHDGAPHGVWKALQSKESTEFTSIDRNGHPRPMLSDENCTEHECKADNINASDDAMVEEPVTGPEKPAAGDGVPFQMATDEEEADVENELQMDAPQDERGPVYMSANADGSDDDKDPEALTGNAEVREESMADEQTPTIDSTNVPPRKSESSESSELTWMPECTIFKAAKDEGREGGNYTDTQPDQKCPNHFLSAAADGRDVAPPVEEFSDYPQTDSVTSPPAAQTESDEKESSAFQKELPNEEMAINESSITAEQVARTDDDSDEISLPKGESSLYSVVNSIESVEATDTLEDKDARTPGEDSVNSENLKLEASSSGLPLGVTAVEPANLDALSRDKELENDGIQKVLLNVDSSQSAPQAFGTDDNSQNETDSDSHEGHDSSKVDPDGVKVVANAAWAAKDRSDVHPWESQNAEVSHAGQRRDEEVPSGGSPNEVATLSHENSHKKAEEVERPSQEEDWDEQDDSHDEIHSEHDLPSTSEAQNDSHRPEVNLKTPKAECPITVIALNDAKDVSGTSEGVEEGNAVDGELSRESSGHLSSPLLEADQERLSSSPEQSSREGSSISSNDDDGREDDDAEAQRSDSLGEMPMETLPDRILRLDSGIRGVADVDQTFTTEDPQSCRASDPALGTATVPKGENEDEFAEATASEEHGISRGASASDGSSVHGEIEESSEAQAVRSDSSSADSRVWSAAQSANESQSLQRVQNNAEDEGSVPVSTHTADVSDSWVSCSPVSVLRGTSSFSNVSRPICSKRRQSAASDVDEGEMPSYEAEWRLVSAQDAFPNEDGSDHPASPERQAIRSSEAKFPFSVVIWCTQSMSALFERRSLR